MSPGSAIAAALLAAGVTTVGGHTLHEARKFRSSGAAKRRDAKRKLKEAPG
jgi:hypothetical protein